MTFADFIARLYAEVPNKHSNTLTWLRQATVRQLGYLSGERALFNEAQVTFTLPVREPYNGEWAGPGLDGFPLDVAEIDLASYQIGSSTIWAPIDGPRPIRDVRLYWPPARVNLTVFSLFPRFFAWHDGKFWINKLGGDVAIRLDYLRDATRDASTGVKITASSTNEKNPWFTEQDGESVLRWAVLADYYQMPPADDAQAQRSGQAATRELQNLKRARVLMKGSGAQTPGCMTSYNTEHGSPWP